MSKKLYVGNLPFSVTDEKLNTLFAELGKVISANVITDKYSGQSRGFGFVEIEDDAAADAAVAKMNNSSFDGRNIVVSEARPMKEKSGSSSSRPFQKRNNKGYGSRGGDNGSSRW